MILRIMIIIWGLRFVLRLVTQHERQQQWQGSVIASVRATEGDCRTLNVRACTGRLRRASCLGPVGDTSCGRQAAPRTHGSLGMPGNHDYSRLYVSET